jgi:hypothetical protein
MEDLEQAAPGLSDEAFVFGSWEYCALAMTAIISEANKKGLQPSAIDDLTEELVRGARNAFRRARHLVQARGPWRGAIGDRGGNRLSEDPLYMRRYRAVVRLRKKLAA